MALVRSFGPGLIIVSAMDRTTSPDAPAAERAIWEDATTIPVDVASAACPTVGGGAAEAELGTSLGVTPEELEA